MGGKDPAQSKVKVIVRVRPLLSSEPNTPCACAVDSKHVRILIPGRTQSYSFKFDSCYDIDSHQEAIFEREIQSRIPTIFEGLNTTVFAYGNTGAGKTFTMQGNDEKPGIIPRVAESMIDLLATSPKASLHMSYVELYNERLYDLLLPRGNDLAIREDRAKNIYIPDLTEIQIKSLASFKQLFETGCKHRSTGATKLNPNSSRSHAILMFKITVQQANTILTGKFNLIDLAGSEDNRKTGNQGIRLTESSNINQSLFVLGNVVNSLNSGSGRIPYRDSKLTRILQDSLGGSSYAVMIANIAPTAAYYHDTLNTLNFALKSRNITNKPTVHATDIVAPVPVQVVADNHAAEHRKNQLDAWKKGKNSQANKENQENNSVLVAQLSKMQQELNSVKSEVQKGKTDANDVFASIESRIQMFLNNQMTLLNLQQIIRDPLASLSNPNRDAPLIELPKNLSAMTPCSKMEKLKQLVEFAASLVREYRYPQAIEVYSFVVPHLTDTHRAKALSRIAFLQQCLCKSVTPGSFIHSAKREESDDETIEQTPYKPFPTSAQPPMSLPLALPSVSSHAPKKPKPFLSSSSSSSSSPPLPPSPSPTSCPSPSSPLTDDSSMYFTPDNTNNKKSQHFEKDTETFSAEDQKSEGEKTRKHSHSDSDEEEKTKKVDKKTRRTKEKEDTGDREDGKKENAKRKTKGLSDGEEEKPEKEKPKKAKEKRRYVSSDEDYEDEEESRKKMRAPKKTKKVKEVASSPDLADSDSEERKELGEKILKILNNGDKKELMKLNGVGEKRALKILEYRNENESFSRLSQLRHVGLTDKFINSLLHTQLD